MVVTTTATTTASPRPLRRARTSSLEEEEEASAMNIYQHSNRPLSSLDSYEEDYYNNEKPSSDCLPLLSWLSLPGSTSTTTTQPPSLRTQVSMDEEKALRISQQLRPFSEEAVIDLGCESSDVSSLEDGSSSSSSSSNPKEYRKLKSLRESLKIKPLDVEQYAARRKMTKNQEKWNALTMIPPSLYCLYFLVSQAWIQTNLVVQAQREYEEYSSHRPPARLFARMSNTFGSNSNNNSDSNGFETLDIPGVAGVVNRWVGDSHSGCLANPESSSSISSSHHWGWVAIPPLTVLALILGTCLHMPFSFIYHWTFAHKLHGKARINHWSRRMDQAMIHFASACFSYGTSGNVTYFLVAALFNLDSALRLLFSKHHRPRTNQMRILIAMIAYLWPILRRGDMDHFSLLFFILALGGWFFSKYPIGGWSHAAFHVVVSFITPVLINVAMELPSSQPQLKLAAQCSVLLNPTPVA
mmetsp:Transcript_18992/g.40845  ORF Transcript_18992/g.40845 Transcript_18992/m.40845 type:complete len:469 (+) Transcript_18992:351-1757(+)